MLDPSAYTLAPNGGGSTKSPTSHLGSGVSSLHVASPDPLWVDDDRWVFKDESLFPKPRTYEGGTRKYRAGRGSSVPLDLSAFDRR
jgi:hypothetical protein